MKKPYYLFLLLLYIFSGCTNNSLEKDKKIISVSILPQKYFVEAIAGNNYYINVMIPPGASPESYEPTSRQMKSLMESRIFLKIGHFPFEETWIKKLLGLNPDLKVYDLSRGIEVISGHSHHDVGSPDEGIDPHIWTSPRNAAIIAGNILKALSEEDPANQDYYNRNYRRFLSVSDSLDRALQTKFDLIKGSSFLIFHPALSYLARDYGLEQLSIEYEGKYPPPGYMKDIIEISRKKNIKAILIQKQFNSEVAEIIAKEISGEVIVIDPLDEDWKHGIEFIADTLVKYSGK